jgi:hypothetical protein
MPSDVVVNRLQPIASGTKYLLFVDPTRTDLDEVERVLSAAGLSDHVAIIPTLERNPALKAPPDLAEKAAAFDWLENHVYATGEQSINIEWGGNCGLLAEVQKEMAREKAAKQ